MVQLKDNVELWIEDLEDVGAIFKLEGHVVITPIPIPAFPVLKVTNEWQGKKVLLLGTSPKVYCCVFVSELFLPSYVINSCDGSSGKARFDKDLFCFIHWGGTTCRQGIGMILEHCKDSQNWNFFYKSGYSQEFKRVSHSPPVVGFAVKWILGELTGVMLHWPVLDSSMLNAKLSFHTFWML